MKCCSLLVAALCFLAMSSRASQAIGIEAAESAEQLIEDCRAKGVFSSSECLYSSLTKKWKYELEYTGKPFAAIGRFEAVRRSVIGRPSRTRAAISDSTGLAALRAASSRGARRM